ncbi:DUF397 domain-containing protein [Nocardiopsis chromatogenes]|uniref:DUF397 domain-containing protein n=1 Tax=Nocardiopsis chromatogenes TaxID=280239 RepID=UPI00034B05F3|nr:DUF397 domain-containing protein [Nocardiopsis chromatogenes]
MTPPVLTWRKSSYSNDTGGECVEFALVPEGGAAVRDTQNRRLGHLSFPTGEWAAFLREVASDRS